MTNRPAVAPLALDLGACLDPALEGALPHLDPLWPGLSPAALRQRAGDVVAGLLRLLAEDDPGAVVRALGRYFDDWIDADLAPSAIETALDGALDALGASLGDFPDLVARLGEEGRRDHLQAEVLRSFHALFRARFVRQVEELKLLNNLTQVGGAIEDFSEHFLGEVGDILQADFAALLYQRGKSVVRKERSPDHYLTFSRARLDRLLTQATAHDPRLLGAMERLFKQGSRAREASTPFQWSSLERMGGQTLPEGLSIAPREPTALLERIDPESMLLAPLFAGREQVGFVALMREHDPAFTPRDWTFFEVATADFSRILETRFLTGELRRLATTDGLTGLLNRRRFFELADQETERARRYGHSYCVLMIDCDDFKSVNDTYGHPVGDAVLKALAASLHMRARTGDLVARYGGEEFVILLLEAGAPAGRSVAEQVRQRIASLRVPAGKGGEEVSFTASVGVAAFPDSGEDLADILSAADDALYAAKKAGKNRVMVAK
ncbi:GGDEF domain-containing protein [bacterium]|nr:GGDEF domain-containing protein [bacterium]